MTDETTMSLDELADSLDRWGGDLNRWPDRRRRQARELLSTSDRARRLHADAVRLDNRLQAATHHRAPAQLRQRIVDELASRLQLPERLLDWFTQTFWRPVAAAACALAVGFTFGVASPPADYQNISDDLNMLAFTTTYAETDDVSQ